ncbi:MAG: twin-arginine translocase TatA/TatE family subunit [Verrucomicrobiota bacterium]|jgi:sec-independent protein translocase protein TatA
MVLATLSEWHIVLALIIILLLFGGKKLPELARGVGEAMKEFKKAQRDVHDETPQSKPVDQPQAPVVKTDTTNPQKPA